jgi:hypothetical protein
MGSAERSRARDGHGVPRVSRFRQEDHGEHGLAWPLHAGGVALGFRDPRFSARGQRRHLAGRAREPVPVCRLGADRGEG